MGLFEAIYVDIKKLGSSAANFIIGTVIVLVLAYLYVNAYVLNNCPFWFAILFGLCEAMVIGALVARAWGGAGFFFVVVIILTIIAFSMGDSTWNSERQPLKCAVVKFGNNPAVTLYEPCMLAKRITHWNQVFEMGMKNPSKKKNVIVLGGFELKKIIGFWHAKKEVVNINLMDVKRIWHKGKVANDKEITFRDGRVVSGRCLKFVGFLGASPGKVWIVGKTPKGKKKKINFEKFNRKDNYIEFYWQ